MILAIRKTMLLPALMVASSVFSQSNADTLWSKGFPNEKMSMGMLTADGTPLIYSDMGGLYGIDPQSGKVAWRADVYVKNPNFRYYPGTPHIEADGYVVNPATGTVLQMGRAAKTADGKAISVQRTFVFPSLNTLLVYGTVNQGVIEGNQDLVFAGLDFTSGKTLWMRTDMFKNAETPATKKPGGFGGFLQEAAKEAVKDDLQKFQDAQNPGDRFLAEPVATKDGLVILPLNLGLFAVSMTDGKVVWKKDYAVKKKGVFTVKPTDASTVLGFNSDSSVLYIARTDFTEAVNPKTGAAIWPAPMPSEGSPGFLYYTSKGLLSLPSIKDATLLQNKRIAFFDPSNGNLKWEIKMKSGVKAFIQSGDTIFLSMQNALDREAVNSFLLDKGQFLFPDNVDIKGNLLNMKLVNNFLLMLGDQQMVIVDRNNGGTVTKPMNKSKDDQWLWTQNQEAVFFMSSGDEKIHHLDLKCGQVSDPIGYEIKLEGKEKPSKLEFYKNNLLVSSDQNMVYINAQTYQVIYQKYYKAPGRSTGGKIWSGFQASLALGGSLLTGATAAVGGMTTVLAVTDPGVQALAQLYPEEVNKEVGDLISTTVETAQFSAGLASETVRQIKEVGKRFKASRQSQDYQFVLSFNDDSQMSLLQIAKSTGMPVASVLLKKNDKAPDYLVDEYAKRLYYIPRVTTMEEIKGTLNTNLDLGKIICLQLK
jgi:outer membrane protein assembly factor BamB